MNKITPRHDALKAATMRTAALHVDLFQYQYGSQIKKEKLPALRMAAMSAAVQLQTIIETRKWAQGK